MASAWRQRSSTRVRWVPLGVFSTRSKGRVRWVPLESFQHAAREYESQGRGLSRWARSALLLTARLCAVTFQDPHRQLCTEAHLREPHFALRFLAWGAAHVQLAELYPNARGLLVTAGEEGAAYCFPAAGKGSRHSAYVQCFKVRRGRAVDECGKVLRTASLSSVRATGTAAGTAPMCSASR